MSQQDNARSNSLRILIADDEPLVRLDLRKMLENMGHLIAGEAGNGAEAVDAARLSKPDVVILDIKMPVMDGIEAAETISSEGIAPVLLLTAYSQADLVERAREAGVYAYMIKPFKETDLMPSIELAMARFAQFAVLESAASTLEERLETRKTVERAKGVLIDRYGLKEQEAFRRLQMQSMNTRKSMREIAEAVLIAHSV
jgi:AmiR/NasT family two-component response regulator